jgi:hypothetical protein
MSKQWQDFFVLVALIAAYFYIIIHHWRGLRLPLSHGRRVRLLFILLIWTVGIPAVFFGVSAQADLMRVLTAPFSN